MTAIVQEPPDGKFRAIDRSVTLARVADELAGGQQICVHGCSRSDLWKLELVGEPYGFDLVFVATPNLATGSVYFARKAQEERDDTRIALLRAAIENAVWPETPIQAGALRPSASPPRPG